MAVTFLGLCGVRATVASYSRLQCWWPHACAGDPATGDPFKGDRAFKGDGQRLLNGDQVASSHSATRCGSSDSGNAGGGCRCCRERRHSRFARARLFTSSCDVTVRGMCEGCTDVVVNVRVLPPHNM